MLSYCCRHARREPANWEGDLIFGNHSWATCPKSCVCGQASSAMAASTISSTCVDSFRWVIGQGTTCQNGSRVSQQPTSWIAPAGNCNPHCALPNL